MNLPKSSNFGLFAPEKYGGWEMNLPKSLNQTACVFSGKTTRCWVYEGDPIFLGIPPACSGDSEAIESFVVEVSGDR